VVTFETELLLGVLGAGLPGAGEGLDRADLGSARGGLGVALAGGVGADVVVLGAGVGFGLPGPADLSAGVLAGLSGFGERGVPPGAGGVPVAAGLGDGGFGLLPDPSPAVPPCRAGDGPGRLRRGCGALRLASAARARARCRRDGPQRRPGERRHARPSPRGRRRRLLTRWH
jgi:hypothetical protein